MPQKKEACHRFKKRKSSKWKNLQFKECNFLAKGFPIEGGYLHPLLKKPFEAKRYYSIDRVFRNVAVDRTHLAKFHQIEGISECPSCISSRLTIRTLSRAWKYSGTILLF
ncbi:putative phenylalanine--tRNA ligase [Helianthus anomalus]